MKAWKWFVLVLLGVYLGIGVAWTISGRGGQVTWVAMFAGGFLVGLLLQRTFESSEES